MATSRMSGARGLGGLEMRVTRLEERLGARRLCLAQGRLEVRGYEVRYLSLNGVLELNHRPQGCFCSCLLGQLLGPWGRSSSVCNNGAAASSLTRRLQLLRGICHKVLG